MNDRGTGRTAGGGMMQFHVIDRTTGKAPDLRQIALTEDWAKGLIYCDMEGFALSEDGGLLLLDETGRFVYADLDRFEVVIDEAAQCQQS